MKWWKVKIWFDNDVFVDEIKGINRVHALLRAWINWENAKKIKIID